MILNLHIYLNTRAVWPESCQLSTVRSVRLYFTEERTVKISDQTYGCALSVKLNLIDVSADSESFKTNCADA